jgi:hypothetical protein
MHDLNGKKEEGVRVQPIPTWTTYADAVNTLNKSAAAFMEHVHLLTEARAAYQEAVSVGAELRHRLDAGDQILKSLMGQLEQVVNSHLFEPVIDRKRPELVRGEPSIARNESTGTNKSFP